MMALETLKGTTSILGYRVLELDNTIPPDDYTKEVAKEKYIIINHKRNSLSFLLQKGNPDEVGVNGCSIEAMLQTVFLIIGQLNLRCRCEENKRALVSLNQAIKSFSRNHVIEMPHQIIGMLGYPIINTLEMISPEEYEDLIAKGYYIFINHKTNSMSFILQKDPVKVSGVNGCQIDIVLYMILVLLGDPLDAPEEYVNTTKQFINQAIDELNSRTKDRVSRDVEGTNNI